MHERRAEDGSRRIDSRYPGDDAAPCGTLSGGAGQQQLEHESCHAIYTGVAARDDDGIGMDRLIDGQLAAVDLLHHAIADDVLPAGIQQRLDELYIRLISDHGLCRLDGFAGPRRHIELAARSYSYNGYLPHSDLHFPPAQARCRSSGPRLSLIAIWYKC